MFTVSTLNKKIHDSVTTYHHGNLRETLLTQGLILLESSQGTEFSMRELTRIIGVSANSVYRHFANKEELLIAMAIHGFEQLLTLQGQAIQNSEDSRQGFILSGKQYIAFAMQYPALFRLMYGRFTVSQADENLKAMANLAYTGMLYAIANTLNVSVDDAKAKVLAVKSRSVVHGLSHLLVDGQFDDLSDLERDNMIDQVLETLKTE